MARVFLLEAAQFKPLMTERSISSLGHCTISGDVIVNASLKNKVQSRDMSSPSVQTHRGPRYSAHRRHVLKITENAY